MTKSSMRVILATTIALGGITFAVWAWTRGGPHAPAVHGGLTIAQDIAGAKAAKLVRPESSEQVAAIVQTFAQRVRGACDRLEPAYALNKERADQFAALATERFALVLEPDYEKYIEHVRRLTNGAVSLDGRGALFDSAEKFANYSKPFRWIPVDAEAVQVRAQWRDGVQIMGHAGGHTYGVSDARKFYSNIGDSMGEMRRARADIYDAWIPMQTSDVESGKSLRVYLVMRFIWTPESPRWRPRFMGINDPTGGDTNLPPPWL